MVQCKQASNTTTLTFVDVAPVVVLGFGGLSIALRSLLELSKGPIPDVDEEIRNLQPDINRVYVPVTSEQAEELRRKGINVLSKNANVKYDLGMLDYVGLGALATLAFFGGYRLVDYFFNKMREDIISDEQKKVRKRIERLLRDNPSSEDRALYDEMIRQENAAASLNKHAGAINNLLAVMMTALGAGIALSAISAYQSAAASGYYNEVKRLRKIRSRRIPQEEFGPESIELVPVESPSQTD